MATVLLFARAREVAGTARAEIPGATLGDVLAAAAGRFGPDFAEVLACARVWVDGEEPALGDDTPVAERAEVAVLPPVSGG